MTRLNMFNSVSLDGYFTDSSNDMSWAHAGGDNKEFQDFVAGNAKGTNALIFGRVTYEMMASFWPTPMAAQAMPEVAKGMNAAPKYVFSRKLKIANWVGTTTSPGLWAWLHPPSTSPLRQGRETPRGISKSIGGSRCRSARSAHR